jgi:lactoylglutathione lyase
MSVSDVTGSITFFYYNDLERASEFYSQVMGFEKVLDVGFAHVFRIYDDVHIGLVDGSRGSMKPAKNKSVMFSMFVDDVDAWHRRLSSKGFDVGLPKEPTYLDMKVLIFKDSEGYTLELLQWINKPF